jgi:pimeloyl-ACP methyl ester carboxylesterase
MLPESAGPMSWGASLGGMVAQELAITRPERLARLVLACTTPGWPAAYPMPAASLRLIMATRGLPLEAARRRHTVHAVSEQAVQRDPALVGRLMEVQGVRPVDQEILSAQAMAGARYSGRLRQGRIQARTLVVHGSADTVVDPRNARLLASCITGARLVTFSGLGHLRFWEDPDGFAAVVKSFLLDADDAGRGPGGLHAIPASSRARTNLSSRSGHPPQLPAHTRFLISWRCALFCRAAQVLEILVCEVERGG